MALLGSECVYTAKNFGLQEENINISKPQGKKTNEENGMGYHRKRREIERQMDRKREKEGGKMQCFVQKDGKSLIDMLKLEYYRRKVLPSKLTNTIEQFIVYVHRNEALFTYIN